jgi:catechol 2,3-dioxygenase
MQSPIEKPFTLHPATRLGHVHYTVADLDRQIAFYQDVLGFKLHWQEGTRAGLGAGSEDLLLLTEVRGARRVPRTTGAYHFALLFPTRRELARAIARLFALRYPNYPTDHVISKTTYLDDPEGNNIELYIPSLEDGTWTVVNGDPIIRHADGTPSNGREPLDVEALFRELTPNDRLDDPLPEETKVGHVHLYGANLNDSMHFYHEVLGFDVMGLLPRFRMGDVSINGQLPHIIAFNTWQGEGAPPPPPDSIGLRYFTIVLPNRTELERVGQQVQKAGIAVEQTQDGLLVRDPSQISIVLTDRSNP